jgi:hypothetical protein
MHDERARALNDARRGSSVSDAAAAALLGSQGAARTTGGAGLLAASAQSPGGATDTQAMEPSMDAARATAAIQEDSALLIQYRYFRSLAPVLSTTAAVTGTSTGATITSGASADGVASVRTLSAGTGFNLARAMRARTSAADVTAAPAPPSLANASMRTESSSGEAVRIPSPKAIPVDPASLLRTVSTIVLSYESQGQPLLAMEALELGGALCVDLARERQRDAARTRVATAPALPTLTGPSSTAGAGSDRADLLFGGDDRAESLFASPGLDRRSYNGGGGGGGDRAELLFGGAADDDLDAPASEARVAPGRAGGLRRTSVGGAPTPEDPDSWMRVTVTELADADPALGHSLVCARGSAALGCAD